MNGNHRDDNERAVQVHCVRGMIEGVLDVAPTMRTTDHLNHACSRFVTLSIDDAPAGLGAIRPGTLAISTRSVLFVVERGMQQRVGDARVEACRFTRCGVRLSLGSYDIEGFIHVPGLTDVTSWLIKNRHPFVPVTAASVVGADFQFAASFLAFNPEHVQLIQQFDPQQELEELEPSLSRAHG